jgi:hypothetical protein
MGMMTLCSNCDNAPRMVSKSGKTLTMCKACQREAWREAKAGKPRSTPAKRTKRTAGIALPGSTPAPAVTPQRRDVRPGVLFVDRVNNRMVLCEVMSETPIRNDATIPYTCQFYAELGYRVVDVVEVMPVPAESAAD